MEPAESEFKNLFLLFFEIFRFSEGHCSNIDTDILFKSAKIVEDTCLKLESIGALQQFEIKLNKFMAMKGFNHIPVQFFEKSSHLLLSKYMTDSNFSDVEVSEAVKQFIANRSKSEFIELVQGLVRTNCSVEILKDICTESSKCSEHNALLYLEELKKVLTNSGSSVEEVDCMISNIVSENKENLKTFLKVLCLPVDCELTQQIQELVALCINSFLRDSESIHLYTCFLKLCDEDFYCLFTRWHSFTDTFVNMIELSVEKLQCDYSTSPYSWKSLDAERSLTFEDITTLINKFKSLPGSFEQFKELLHKLQQEGYRVVVEDLSRICKIK